MVKFPHFHVSDTCRVSIQPDAPVATAARAAGTGRVGMSTRPDPDRSGAVEIATRRRRRLRVVWGLRELKLLVVVLYDDLSSEYEYLPAWSIPTTFHNLHAWSKLRQ